MSTSSNEIFFALRQICKAKGITYRDLGKSLKISEAGVKKMFQSQDCSISRLSQICGALGIPTGTIFNMAQNFPLPEIELSRSQSDFLAKNPHYFNFFQKLVFERLTVSEIAGAHGLSEKSVRRYLKKLEEMGLIEVHPKDRIKTTFSSPSRIRINGQPLNQLRKKNIFNFINNMHGERENQVLGTVHFKLSANTAKKFRSELLDVVSKYYVQSEIEQNMAKRFELEPVNLVLAMAPHALVGDIINLD